MLPTPIVVLEIDDNTSASNPPFTNDVSMWSFRNDLNLATRSAAEVFRALHHHADASQFRGYPERVAESTFRLFDSLIEESEVSWLTAAEIGTERPWLLAGESATDRTLALLFGTIDSAARQFGPERVRLVFAFC